MFVRIQLSRSSAVCACGYSKRSANPQRPTCSVPEGGLCAIKAWQRAVDIPLQLCCDSVSLKWDCKGVEHLLELALAGADADLPAIIDALVHAGRLLVLHVQFHIVLEGLDGQPLPVQQHLQHTRAMWRHSHTHTPAHLHVPGSCWCTLRSLSKVTLYNVCRVRGPAPFAPQMRWDGSSLPCPCFSREHGWLKTTMIHQWNGYSAPLGRTCHPSPGQASCCP